jgi:putative ABC transport system ATP-binding protein
MEIVAELADGGEELRSVVPAGEYFGEIGPLFAMPRSATARARTTAVVIGYTAQDFRARIGSGRVAAAAGDVVSRAVLAGIAHSQC